MREDAHIRTFRPRGVYIWPFIATFMLVAVAEDAFAQDISILAKQLRAAGYQLYNPPRANWGPGFVFAGDVDVKTNLIKNVEEVCPNLYSAPEPMEGSRIVLANYEAADHFSIQLAFDFLRGLVRAGLNLGGINERKVEIKWTDVREMSYTHMDQWLESGELRPVEKRCRLAIADLKRKNKFDDRVFVITRAVAPQSLIFDFGRLAKVEAGLSARIEQLGAAVKASGKGYLANKTELVIKERLYVGYAPPFNIKDWAPSGLLSGDIVKVRGTVSNLRFE